MQNKTKQTNKQKKKKKKKKKKKHYIRASSFKAESGELVWYKLIKKIANETMISYTTASLNTLTALLMYYILKWK